MFMVRNLLAPGVWRDASQIDVANAVRSTFGTELSMSEYVVQDDRWLVGRTYVVGGKRTANGLLAQALYGIGTMTQSVPAGLIALAVRCDRDCVGARNVLNAFWSRTGAELVAAIPEQMSRVRRQQTTSRRLVN